MTDGPVDLPVTIRPEAVHRYMGYPEGRQPPARVARMVGPLVKEARRLARARGVFALLATDRAAEVGLDPLASRGRGARGGSSPTASEALAVGLVTAGGGIEAAASARARASEATASLVLDAAGTAAAEEAADRLCALIVGGEGDDEAVGVPCRLSPGYGSWPIERQRQLFDVLPAADIGVVLLPSMLMVPRKSVSFAMRLGAGSRPGDAAAGCPRCALERCRYRRGRREQEAT
jgi:hypothetical protein